MISGSVSSADVGCVLMSSWDVSGSVGSVAVGCVSGSGETGTGGTGVFIGRDRLDEVTADAAASVTGSGGVVSDSAGASVTDHMSTGVVSNGSDATMEWGLVDRSWLAGRSATIGPGGT